MITFVTTQLLHLELDKIENGRVVDASGKGNDGTVHGTPQILPDDTLGACLSLDGSTEYIDVPLASVPTGNEITVSFWAYGGDALPKNCAIIEATDAKGMTTLSIRVPWGDSTVYFNCGNDGSSVDSIFQAAQPTDFKGKWTFWAFTKSASTGQMNIYRNGTLWLSGTGKSKPLPASTVVKVGATADGNNLYQGKIAHVRVYNQALAVADITHDMEADQTALSSFRKSYPIDFRLYNDDEQEVLDITDDPAGQNLHLEVSNASGQVINLIAPSNSTPSANNYHFALRFRPDTLSVAFQTYASFTAFALQTTRQTDSQVVKQAESQGAKQLPGLSQAFQLFAASALPTVRPPAVSSALQSFAVGAASALQGAQPPAPAAVSSALQAFAVDTASMLQGTLQEQGWNIGYQEEPSGTVVVYFLSTQAQSLAVGTKVAVTLPHVSASGAGGARGTRVELRYQQMTFGDNMTPVSGSRQIHLSIVNQRGQKQIPLHVSFVGFNTILNDGQAQNTLALRITNILKDGTIALNPTGSNAASKFILSFDVQADNESRDWALGTVSQVRAIQVTVAGAENWSITPPSGQEESPEWILTPTQSKTALAADEAIQLTLANIISSLPSGQTNLYIRYENIPGYWDGQFVLSIEKTPLLYRGSNVSIGTINPTATLTVSTPGQPASSQQPSHLQLRREATEKSGDKILFLELYQDENPQPTVPEVHPSIRFHHHNRFWQRIEGRADGIHFKTGDLTSDGYIDIFAGNGHFRGNDFQLSVTNAQEHNWGLVNWTDDKLYFQYREQGVFKNNAMYLDKNGLLVLGSLSMGGNALQQGVNFTGGYPVQFQSSGGSYTLEPLVSPNAIRIVGGDGGVLAVNAGDVLAWASYGIVVKGNVWAQNKYFLIDHPTKPDHSLIHACLEGPESSVYYRGQAQLKNGQAIIYLPDYFEVLTHQEGRTVLLTPKGREPFLLSHEDIVDGTFKVYGTRADGAFSWEVKAVRADVGRLEVEVRK